MPKIATTSSLSSYPKLAISQYKERLTENAHSIKLDYRFQDKAYQYNVVLTKTACNYGNYRYWWLCPNCSKRVGVLYCAGVFVCRHCTNSPYQCQLEQPIDKLFRKIAKMRDKLGWTGGLAHGIQGKPKGMHQRTYDRLVWEYLNIAEKVIFATSQSMGITLPSQIDNR